MNFKPKPSLGLATMNRILQTSLEQQLSSTGNVSNSMFDYIDENKFFLTENRTPFIQHTSNNMTFQIENSDLPYENWIEVVYEKITKSKNTYIPFTIIEKLTRGRKRKVKEEPMIEDDFDNHQGVNSIKKRKISETSELFNTVQNNNLLFDKKDQKHIVDVLKFNTYIEFVDELEKKFNINDGEEKMKSMSDEQKECLNHIIEYAFSTNSSDEKMDTTNNPFFKIFLIEGSAGCGKSSIIENLNFYIFKNHNQYSRLLYITQTNVLCQSMRMKCLYNYNMQYLTFFKFLTILDLNFFDKRQLLLNCDALQIDAFQHTIGVNFLRNIKNIIQLPPLNENGSGGGEKSRLFIIFDEIYTISSGKISLFLFIVRCIKLKYPHISIYCILIGDKFQLRPFTKIENIKLKVIKSEPKESPENSNTINEEKIEIKEEEDLDTISLIEQSESIANATHFTLSKQFRIVDHEYHCFVNRVRNAENTRESGIELMREIQKLWPEKISDKLEVEYPIDDIQTLLETVNMKDYRNIAKTFVENNIFDRTLDTTIFCFTNKHAHYYNVALAFSYWNQIEIKYDKQCTDFIIFSVIYNCSYLKFMNKTTKISELINNTNYLINILPLIRYCPYKVLSSNCPVARLSIVYLLDWVINEQRNITHLIVFSPDTNYIFSMLPDRFEMNLFKNTHLFGFPLQFAFSSTFASSQGLTLNNKIAISCANISKSELYVCLTRIKSSKDLIRIY